MRLALIAIGYLAACVFTASSIGAERRSSEPVHSFSAPGQDRIDLYAEPDTACNGEHKRAVYTFRDTVPIAGATLEGCYVIKDGTVYMIWEDGDQFKAPLRAFTGRAT